MKSKMIVLSMGILLGFTPHLFAGEQASDHRDTTATSAPAKVKYTSGKDVDFEQLLIQGEIQRPEVSVVTGDTNQNTDGLLRLRTNFIDQMAMDAGEKIQ